MCYTTTFRRGLENKGEVSMEMFCLKCRKKVDVDNKKIDESSINGRKMLRASCPQCNSGLAKFVKASVSL
jgi:DNA-directed RNA polymerase subunit RPC12/RpoP